MNQLYQSHSPYLQQHANNPVHWQLWTPETLSLAKAQDKPILLSIGYSTCHWCHVMAHESFEDQATADLMNQHFINIKLDREQRPDLDRVFQLAHQLMNQRGGGWPLTAFIDPRDLTPFFIGTYFPKTARFGLPSFVDILKRIAEVFANRRDDISAQNSSLRDALLAQSKIEPHAGQLDGAPINTAIQQLVQFCDPDNGGLGKAPKFPHPTQWQALLQLRAAIAGAAQQQVDELIHAALNGMQQGGLFDHLGGGFFRYCVDAEWQIPHFEKMLYDNAALLTLYSDAARLYSRHDYAATARLTADWLLREMQSSQGGFFSALDADSEHGEGDYYLWDAAAIQKALPKELSELALRAYGLDQPANFEDRWHLQRRASLNELAGATSIPLTAIPWQLEQARAQLLLARQTRVYPHRDDKQLLAWNALAVSAFIAAHRALNDDKYAQAAEQTLAFIECHLLNDGDLFASFSQGVAEFNACLEDYANYLNALLDSLQWRFSCARLNLAMKIAQRLLEQFQDAEQGGFFHTAHKAEKLLQRSRPFADEASASGNGMAALALQRLGLFLGDLNYVDSAEHTLRAAWAEINEIPYACATLLRALDDYLLPPEVIVVVGNTLALLPFRQRLQAYDAKTMVFYLDTSDDIPVRLIQKYPPPPKDAWAYRCKQGVCYAPISDVESLLNQSSV